MEFWRLHATALHPHDAADFALFPLLVLAEAVAGTVRGRVSVPSRETPNGEAVWPGSRCPGFAPATPADFRGSGRDASPSSSLHGLRADLRSGEMLLHRRAVCVLDTPSS